MFGNTKYRRVNWSIHRVLLEELTSHSSKRIRFEQKQHQQNIKLRQIYKHFPNTPKLYFIVVSRFDDFTDSQTLAKSVLRPTFCLDYERSSVAGHGRLPPGRGFQQS